MQFVSPANKFGGSIADPNPAATQDQTAITSVAPSVVPAMGGMGNPNSPMFWFGIIAATAVGCMAYSTVVRD